MFHNEYSGHVFILNNLKRIIYAETYYKYVQLCNLTTTITNGPSSFLYWKLLLYIIIYKYVFTKEIILQTD